MRAPVWLLPNAGLAFHTECIHAHGGSDGVRDDGLLESALARPKHLFQYEKVDLCRLAAACAVGIAKNHPFVDGNKRTAFLAATVFLERNGVGVVAEPGAAAVFMLGVADGSLDDLAFAAWLRDNTQVRSRGARRVVRGAKKKKA
ncbi:MAG: type II toxin-antitoxin system death-on-curing family toxin [Planctomycetota bacterium]